MDKIEEFIEDVREHPELYLKSHKDYMDTLKKNKIWNELGSKHHIEDGNNHIPKLLLHIFKIQLTVNNK